MLYTIRQIKKSMNMRLFVGFLEIILVYSFNIISLVYPTRYVYISSQIASNPSQVDYIKSAIDKNGLIIMSEKQLRE